MNITEEQIVLALLPSLYLRELDSKSIRDKPGSEALNKAKRAAEQARFAAEQMVKVLGPKP